MKHKANELNINRLGPDITPDDFHVKRGFNPVENARTPYFEDYNSARLGLKTEIMRRDSEGEVFFIATLANVGKFRVNKQPTVAVGEVDIERVRGFDLMHTSKSDHLLVPVKTHCEFYFALEPCSTESTYAEIGIAKGRLGGYRPKVFLGSKDSLKDVITNPVHASSESFISELSEFFGPVAEDKPERVRHVTNEIFNLLSF